MQAQKITPSTPTLIGSIMLHLIHYITQLRTHAYVTTAYADIPMPLVNISNYILGLLISLQAGNYMDFV
jgi:hypothetical protein